MGYKLATGNDDCSFNIIKEISEDELNTINDKIRELQKVMMCKDYYMIIIDNIEEWQNALQRYDIIDRKGITTLNRYMYNILGAFYAWIEYNESNYKSIFGKIKGDYYDNYFEYRMMYNLRTYMTHCEMGISQVEIDFDKGEVNIYASPKELLEKGKSRLQSKIKQELKVMEQNNEMLDIDELVTGFKEMFKAMHKDLMAELELGVRKIMNFFASECNPTEDTFVLSEDEKKIIMNINNFVRLFYNKVY